MDFTNKVCVVTGGAKGIGRCIVESFAGRGARLAFIDTDRTVGERLAAGLGPETIFLPGDVASEEDLRSFAALVLDRFERVDYLINNAGLSKKGLLSGCSYEEFMYVQRVSLGAPYLLSLLFRDAFAPGAAMVNLSSTRARMSQADTESYSAAKGGICALTHALSVSLAGKVRVNAVSPGWIDTGAWQGEPNYQLCHSEADLKQHPVGRVGRPEDIASMVMFLCDEQAGFVSGQNFVVDGGMTRLMIYHGDEGWSYAPTGWSVQAPD